MEGVSSEARILSKLNHPRIVRFLGVIEQIDDLVIVMEYLPLGTLLSYYQTNTIPSLSLRHSLAKDLAAGMAFLESVKVMHRDLKSLNVLMHRDADEGMRCKIADFGIAVAGGEGKEKVRGSMVWMAPELVRGDGKTTYTTQCDIYSYGVVLTEIYSWSGPFTLPLPNSVTTSSMPIS
ncbi:kinase-like domain-containing protein [Chytridium lagenaria]|nr:kinase-like domain-containing protein [Chytridium lagenaria]